MAFLLLGGYMKIDKFELGMYQANCYLIWDKNHVLIVDPGGSSKKIVEHINEKDGIVDAILLTHGHVDHIEGVDFFYSKYKCPVYVEEADFKMIENPKFNCSATFSGFTQQVNILFYQSNMNINNFEFDVISAPGHTNGSVLLVFDDIMFSGDVLFKNSIGRCDLPTGSNAKMFQTLKAIKMMSGDYIVYPGHGPKTTLQDEIKLNPFLKEM